MNPDTITAEMIVADVFERWPQTVPVFLDHGMSCVGCDMSIFEYLSDAVQMYGLEVEDFIAELNRVISTPAAIGDSTSGFDKEE